MIKKFFILLITLFSLSFVAPVYAGTDLTVTCADNGPCDIAPSGGKLFDESNILPGDSFDQTLTVVNDDTNETCNLVLDVTEGEESSGGVNLATRIFSAIYEGATGYFGNLVAGSPDATKTYQDLYDEPSISLGSLSPGTTRTFTWYALFDYLAGNEYQARSTVFDISINITCDAAPDSSPTPPPGSPTPSSPSPDVCTAEVPTTAPILSVGANTDGTALLTWTAVSPVTHYAINFGVEPGVYLYGNPNVGNTTSYLVTGLNPGTRYYFQVLGINDCAPGPKSNEDDTGGSAFTGGVPPLPGGFTEEILGISDDASKSADLESEGDVAGVSSCIAWKVYLPLILLLAQGVLLFFLEFRLKKDTSLTKLWLSIVATLISIAVFYYLRECDCASNVLLGWLCKYYWVVAVILTLLSRVFGYAFLEDEE